RPDAVGRRVRVLRVRRVLPELEPPRTPAGAPAAPARTPRAALAAQRRPGAFACDGCYLVSSSALRFILATAALIITPTPAPAKPQTTSATARFCGSNSPGRSPAAPPGLPAATR